MFPFPAVNAAAIPWDFALILAILGLIIPWRGALRVRLLLSRPNFGTSDRLSLYGTTIGFQWILVVLVAWRALSRNVGLMELGLTIANPSRTLWSTAILTLLLCASQFASVSTIVRVPYGERGSVFQITERIMPRTSIETLVFVALACTAGVSEEFLYRGFVFTVFTRLFAGLALFSLYAAILCSAWFAIGHLYQGRRGIITTFVVGMIFCGVRIWSGSLIPVVVAHTGIDLVAGLYISSFSRRATGDV